MDIRVNDILWHIQFKKPTSSELKRSDGTISLGVTDNTTKTITIADNVSDYMADKILCHELVHLSMCDSTRTYSRTTCDSSNGCTLDFLYTLKRDINIPSGNA